MLKRICAALAATIVLGIAAPAHADTPTVVSGCVGDTYTAGHQVCIDVTRDGNTVTSVRIRCHGWFGARNIELPAIGGRFLRITDTNTHVLWALPHPREAAGIGISFGWVHNLSWPMCEKTFPVNFTFDHAISVQYGHHAHYYKQTDPYRTRIVAAVLTLS